MPKVAITTVNFSRQKDTLDWLASLRKLDTKGVETKIFIVSNENLDPKKNHSSKKNDPSLEIALEMILTKENRGSAGGYNDTARAALKWGADYILMFNNDTLIKSPNLLKSLLETAKSDDTIGVVAPKMLFAPGFEFFRERYSARETGRVIWYAGGSFDWSNVLSVHRGIDEVDKGQFDQICETEFINITCILVKSEVFKKDIFFDEDLFAYFDDGDWSKRVVRAGFKQYYDGRVAIFHKVSQTAGVGSPISDYYIARNRLIFGLRYAPPRTKLALLREAIRLIFSGRPAQKRGVWDFFLGKRGELRN